MMGIAAGGMAGTAIVNDVLARRAEDANPPKGRFVEVDGVRLHYVSKGSGPALVLLHGNGSMVEDFLTSGLFDLAAERFQVFAFDRPGYGHSERPRSTVWTPTAQAALLYRAMHELGIARPLVLGHSWGTLVAIALGLNHSQSVRGLILVSGYYFPTARVDAALLSPPALPVLGDVMRYTASPLLGRLLAPRILRKIFAPRPLPRRFLEGFSVEMALRPSQIRASAAESGLMVPAAAQLQKRYGELRMPVAIVSGDGDRIVDFEVQSAELHGRVPQSTLRILPGLGHMVHHFAAAEIMEEIDKLATPAPTAMAAE